LRALAETNTPRAGFFLAVRYIPMFIRLVWATHRGYTVAIIILRIARAFTPVAMFWVGKMIIDEVVALRAGEHVGYSRLWELVAFEFLVVLVGEMLSRASTLVESLLGDLFSIHISVRLMEHAATLDSSSLKTRISMTFWSAPAARSRIRLGSLRPWSRWARTR
jgi:hypothetical protein